MRILILGCNGMLGHRLFLELKKNHEVFGTIRENKEKLIKFKGFDENKIIPNCDVRNLVSLEKIVNEINPEIIFNCVGIIKQVDESHDPISCIEINALFPHRLAKMFSGGRRIIHFSTDCVFDGLKGNYSENEHPNATDLYGMTKALGEVQNNKNFLTIRTSIIGRELDPKGSLIDWFLSQEGKEVKGFTNAIYTGLPTQTLSKIIENYILPNKTLFGLYHISSSPINKFELLNLVREEFKNNIKILPFNEFKIDRSLDSSHFSKKTGFKAPPWNDLVKEINIDSPLYKNYR